VKHDTVGSILDLAASPVGWGLWRRNTPWKPLSTENYFTICEHMWL